MRQSILTTVLVSASLSAAAPLWRRINIDQAATAEAQRKDNTATRAFTAVPIKTSNGQCLAVDPNSGDFRRNLMNVVSAPCDGSSNQQFDVITKGTHNNVAGQALIVSSSFLNCLNFDPRRAAGNQVIMFSCGGRADGDGQVTDSQLFAFDGSKTTLPLVPQNSNRDGTVCLKLINGTLDQTRCNAAQPTNDELFTIGNGAAAAPPPPATATSTSSSAAPPASTTAPSVPATTIRIDDAATKEAQRFDNTATRAFTAIPIKTSDGKCLSIDPNSGDFRRNLMNIVPVTCDGSANQQFDVITKGTHNNVSGQALIVSTLFLNCLNFDPRRAAGNQVLMFSCGGRADGDGQVTDSQLFAFDGSKTTLPLVPQNSNRDGTVCFTVINGKLDQTRCNPAQPNNQELFTLGNGAAAAPPPPPATSAPATTATSTSSSAAPPASTAAPAPPVTTIRIDEAATKEAQRFDNTATRAFTAIPIKTSDGKCLSVDTNSGDFRRNLMNIVPATCDGSAAQQFDVITKGIHNNVTGQALIVSSSFLNCMNFDSRRAPGNQVLMFSCGGRGDGTGEVTDSQLFPFDGTKTTLPLVPQNSLRDGAVCFTVINGLLDQTRCNPAQPNNQELFTLGNGAPAAPPATTKTSAAVTSTSSASAAPPATSAPALTVAPAPPASTIRIDDAATKEAQRRDNGATRAFTNAPIKTSNGQCLAVDPNSGDFRRNLMNVVSAPCDGSAAQQFDVITKGTHNNVAGQALIVSSSFLNCLNFDPRRAAGNQVLMFSCGGRADGDGQVTDSQLFPFDGSKTTLPFVPQNSLRDGAVCFSIINGKLDQSRCNPAQPNANQLFTIGNGAAAAPPAVTTPPPASTTTAAPPAGNTSPAGTVVLDLAAVAEAHQRDATATRAFSGVPIHVDGKCLSVNLNSGDFRQNLMEIDVAPCDNSPQQQFDILTSGKHNNQAGQALVVSSLTQGCLNVDERRQPGNQVIIFSCGGRADGSGQVTNSQLFAFNGQKTNIPLVPGNVNKAKCLFDNNGKLDLQPCNPAAPNGAQTFSIA